MEPLLDGTLKNDANVEKFILPMEVSTEGRESAVNLHFQFFYENRADPSFANRRFQSNTSELTVTRQ